MSRTGLQADEADLTGDPLVNTASESVFQMAAIGYHILAVVGPPLGGENRVFHRHGLVLN